MYDYNTPDDAELNEYDFEDADLDADPYGGEWDAWQSQFDDDPSPYGGTYSEM